MSIALQLLKELSQTTTGLACKGIQRNETHWKWENQILALIHKADVYALELTKSGNILIKTNTGSCSSCQHQTISWDDAHTALTDHASTALQNRKLSPHHAGIHFVPCTGSSSPLSKYRDGACKRSQTNLCVCVSPSLLKLHNGTGKELWGIAFFTPSIINWSNKRCWFSLRSLLSCLYQSVVFLSASLFVSSDTIQRKHTENTYVSSLNLPFPLPMERVCQLAHWPSSRVQHTLSLLGKSRNLVFFHYFLTDPTSQHASLSQWSFFLAGLSDLLVAGWHASENRSLRE